MFKAQSTIATHYWHQSPQQADRLVCDLCPRYCELKAGQRGFCYVRANFVVQKVRVFFRNGLHTHSTWNKTFIQKNGLDE